MDNKKLSKENILNKLNTADNVFDFVKYNLEYLVEYLQYACEYFTQNCGFGASEIFYENFRDLRRIAASKLLQQEHIYVMMAHPLMPLYTEETGEFGITFATTRKGAEILLEEQKKKGRRCFAAEINGKQNMRDYLRKSFFIDGYDHIVVWNSEMKTSFFLEDDLFKDNEKHRFKKYVSNNGLFSKVACYQQTISAVFEGVPIDKEVFFQNEIKSFAAIMDAELIVPVEKNGKEPEVISDENFVQRVPLKDFNRGDKEIKLFPVYTDLDTFLHSEYSLEDYSFYRVNIEDLLYLLPCEHIVINHSTIGLIIQKDIVLEKIAAVKKFVNDFSDEKILAQFHQ